MPGIGLGLGIGVTPESGGGSPPPPGYTTGAVAFDGLTYILNSALASSDNETLSYVFWLNNQDVASVNDDIVFIVDPLGVYGSEFDVPVGDPGQVTITDITGDAGNAFRSSEPSVTTNQWVCYLVSGNAGATPAIQIYKGDTDASGTVVGSGNPFTIAFNGLPLYIGSDTGIGTTDSDALIGYLADLRIMPGQLIDFSLTANRRNFINAEGKPVDPAVATAAYGAPAVLLRRAPMAEPSTFADNLGTGGPFTIGGGGSTTGALVNMVDTVVVGDLTYAQPGAFITATGVPTGTTVVSNDGISTVTMSAAATATNPTAAIQFGGVLGAAPSSPSD